MTSRGSLVSISISISGTRPAKHELEISDDGETWKGSAASIIPTTAPGDTTSSLAGFAAAAVWLRTTLGESPSG
jgi:hypothetical protein